MKRSLWEEVVKALPLVEALLARHQVPTDQAEEILEQLFSKLCLHHPGVADPGAWLVSALRRALRQTYGRTARK